MVTLAFAQAGSVLVFKNPYRWTGGEDGFGVDYTKLRYQGTTALDHAREHFGGRRSRSAAAGAELRRFFANGECAGQRGFRGAP